MTREPKREQTAAIETLKQHVSVTAGPGAGKTFVLVERYLHILRTNPRLNIDQIVAITFTNRAANEMRERLRKRLDEILEETSGDDRRRWMRYKRTLDGAIITTIHGFCSRLLREFPVEAHLDPQFVLLDEHQAAALLEHAVEESLTEFINAGHEAVSRIVAGVGRSRLAAALVDLYKDVRGQGLSISQLSEYALGSHSTWDDYLAAVADVDAAIADLLSVRRLSPTAEARRSALAEHWPRVRNRMLDQDLPLSDYCREIVELKEIAKLDARQPVAELVKRINETFWGDKPRTYGLAPRLRFDLVAKEYSAQALEVLKSIHKRLNETKRQLAVMDFDDLQVRALKLLEQEEVLLRAARRYKFFLIDEFQDTNPLQRDLMTRLALADRNDANLFIVGDPKQSIYGFRGADVGVFSQMTEELLKGGGAERPLHLNFRSQPPLINFFNLLFEKLFQPDDEIDRADLPRLGYVSHEPSVAQRETNDEGPLVELLVDTITSENLSWKRQMSLKERDAQQLAHRVNSLMTSEINGRRLEYRDIAVLFRAMTGAQFYEAAFRRANIPYQTVLGRGFYEREEITDLIQLLRFLDNRTDEIALAAILRSPLCGISDNTLLALRLAPKIGETGAGEVPRARKTPRKLFYALRRQEEIDFIAAEERAALIRAKTFLQSLIEKRNRYPVGDLLRLAVRSSEYMTVVAANFDGAQKLANVEKLFSLAERFERSGAHLIRDFVKYVHDFEAIGSRESEGQLDESANAVTFMTIHQAKGLEFPVVALADLHRTQPPQDKWFLLDRHLGLTLKVPDGRDNQVAGDTFKKFSDRARQREVFESLRLLYVGATRAQDRLILSGVADDLTKLSVGRDCWLKWIWQALELENARRSDVIDLGQHVQLQLQLNLNDLMRDSPAPPWSTPEDSTWEADLNQPAEKLFPLLAPVERALDSSAHRFSVTQLINYQRCARQYYFDRVLHLPSSDEVAAWNDAESPEPPANLTATLKGSVIHRFCEIYASGDDADARLRQSLDEVLRSRQSQMADRFLEIDIDKAIEELTALSQNYLRSDVFRRIESVRALVGKQARRFPEDAAGPDDPQEDPSGLWSELSFRLRRPNGLITGTIDKLLISPSANGDGYEVEIIDFKTNRFRVANKSEKSAVAVPTRAVELVKKRGVKERSSNGGGQFSFDFEITAVADSAPVESSVPNVNTQVRDTAADYNLQMQAYALAVRQLIPNLANTAKIRVTLHFLQPDVEFQLHDDLLDSETCAAALDAAMTAIISSAEPAEFPVYPAAHCRMCNFREVCAPGREWLHGHH